MIRSAWLSRGSMTLVVLVVHLATISSASGQDASLLHSSIVFVLRDGAAVHLYGSIVDLDTGAPLRSAQVYQGNRGVLTNADGWFHLVLPPDGPVRLRVELVGYRSVALDLPEPVRSRHFYLLHAPFLDCERFGLTPDPQGGRAKLHLRDVVTSEPLTSEVVVSIRSLNTGEEVVSRVMAELGVVPLPISTAGVYDLVVTATGYEPFQLSPLIARFEVCYGVEASERTVWLVPDVRARGEPE